MKIKNMFLSVVIAIYNEEGNVEELTRRMYKSMKSLRLPFELIYIIDGTDNSFKILNTIKKSKRNLILDHSPVLRGFKNSFVKGFSLVNKKATHILTMDGDLNHRPEEIKKLIKRMQESKSDIVVGSRYIKQGKIIKTSLFKKVVSRIANTIINLLWGLKVKDKTSGFRLYKKEVINGVTPLCKSKNFEFLFEILILSQKFRFKISEAPIIYEARESGESKFKFFKVLKGYIKLMFKYFLFNPKKEISIKK